MPPGLNSASNPSLGWFNGTNTLVGELTYAPSDAVNFSLLYARSHLTPSFGGLIGGSTGLPIRGFADDGFGGDLRPAMANTYGVNLDWKLSPKLGLFGRYSFGDTQLRPVNGAIAPFRVQNQSMQLGVAIADLGKPGAQATLTAVIPSDVVKGRDRLIAGGGDGGTQYDLEATYFYPISNRIALVPSFYAIIHPNNFSSNPTVYVGNIRMQFSF